MIMYYMFVRYLGYRTGDGECFVVVVNRTRFPSGDTGTAKKNIHNKVFYHTSHAGGNSISKESSSCVRVVD